MKRVNYIAEKNNLLVIEDAAQALMCKYEEEYVGTIGDIGCFSLSMAKMISTGQGGFCVTKNRDIAEKLRKIRSHGVENVLKVKMWKMQGGNFKYTDIQAAICKAQLKKLERNIESVRELNQIYKNGIKNRDFISLTSGHNIDEIPLYNDFKVKQTNKWLKLFDDMKIEARRFYPSMNKVNYIEENKGNNNYMEYSKEYDEMGIYLPSGPNADIAKVKQMIEEINKI